MSELNKYVGSVYLNKDYQKANVIDEKSRSYDARLKYNIYTDGLELKEGGQLREVIKSSTTYARIDNDYYYYCNFKNTRGVKKNGYYILVELNNNYRVYKKYSLKITDPQEMDPMTGSSVTGKIKLITTYYLENANEIQELPLNKKGILSAFSDKQSELKEYIKKEKIKLKKEEDLIRLVARYNALKNIDLNQPGSLLSNRVQNN
ncbi:hypothetical protein [Aquimarina sp. AU474]|uniref:hypothetical protein n=1 Tax=Aquimarina sp. AU474 TaxID=2108529 RepID=UPI001F36BDFA|nr:hypothetical protein [Aquimarina sp. AU474]